MEKNIKTKPSLNVVAVIIVALAFVMPGTTVFADIEQQLHIGSSNISDNVMMVQNTSGMPGDAGHVICINGTWSVDLGAYTIAMCYDSTNIEITSVTLDNAVVHDTPLGTWIFIPNYGTPGWMTAAVFNTAYPEPDDYPIPAGGGTLLTIVINITEDATIGETVLDLTDSAGSPPVNSIFVDTNSNTIHPDLVNGVLTISEGPENQPTEFSEQDPYHEEPDVLVTLPELSVTIEDPEEDLFNWSIETNPDIGSNSALNDDTGPKTCTITVPELGYNTTYTWYVNATDTGSGDTTEAMYTFTTESFSNSPPNAPTITGPASGKVGEEHEYTFKAVDPDGHDIYLWIDWGDDTNSGWIGLYGSGEEIKVKHTWSEKGDYTIRAKAKDTNDSEGAWGTLEISMPRNRLSLYSLFLRFLEKLTERFPLLGKLLEQVLSSPIFNI